MRVGVIGLGGMGRGHVRVLKRLKIVTDVIGCDLNEAVRKAAAKDKILITASVAELIAAAPQAVFVVTPPAHHAACIRACFEAGIPVFTEKPLAATIEDSRALVALAQARGLAFQVGFELRYCGLTRAMR
ncbi:MAG TPA: Gfo/Idh/MocA family oxidoreductase, partial [Planctomycetota bacterium]|nr:Gfo/Idh/MocA family oxidoreductase [Planctomycetota bacterium]